MNCNSDSNQKQFEQCYYGNYNKYWYENNCDNRQTWNQCINFPCNEKAFDAANKKCCSMGADVISEKYGGCMDKCLRDQYNH